MSTTPAALIGYLKGDATLMAMLPGGIWLGRAPALPDGPGTDTPGEPVEDYASLFDLASPRETTSTSHIDEEGYQLSVFTSDRGDSADAREKARKAIERVVELIEDDDLRFLDFGATLVDVRVASLNYLQDDELGWQGLLDLVVRTSQQRTTVV